jgi:hypothetical protein
VIFDIFKHIQVALLVFEKLLKELLGDLVLTFFNQIKKQFSNGYEGSQGVSFHFTGKVSRFLRGWICRTIRGSQTYHKRARSESIEHSGRVLITHERSQTLSIA